MPRKPTKKLAPPNKALRVALTGGTGFSGAFILPQLIAAGHDVVALARNPDVLKGKCEKVIGGDLSRDDILARLVEGADVVAHVGGATTALNRDGYFDVNFDGTKRLFDAAQKAGVKRFVFVSSLAAREPRLSDYGASKASAEEFLLQQKPQDMSIAILRPPAIYGPGDKATLELFKLLQAPVAFMPGRRGARFSLLYVADFARIVTESVSNTAQGLFELDDQALGYDWEQIAQANRALMGKPKRVVYLPHALVHAVAGVAELASRFKGKPGVMSRQKINYIYHPDWVSRDNVWPLNNPVQMKDGLPQTLAWYQAHGWLPPKNEKARSAA